MSEPLGVTIRNRSIPQSPLRTYVYRRWIVNMTPVADTIVSASAIGNETTSSRRGSNWLAYKRLKAKSVKTGHKLSNAGLLSTADLGTGGFTNIKQYQELNHPRMVNFDVVDKGYRQAYAGPWVAKDQLVGQNSSLYPAVPSNLDDLMLLRGATAVSRTIPTNPVASAAQFIGELREGTPRIPGRALKRDFGAHSVADEYLNVEFGIKPFVNDLQKFAEAHRSANKVIDQLKRDSGRLIRRRYTFPIERVHTASVTQSTSAYGSPAFNLSGAKPYVGGPGKLTKSRTETWEFWFSGAYTYHYPDGDSAVERMRAKDAELNKLYGTRINANTLWELTPWSWAADWVGNTGDVVKNLSALSSDSLVLKWGYIMCKYTCRDTYLLEGVSLVGLPPGPYSQTFITEVKKRNKATPYGFGLDTAAFTTRQWAILGALGISRGTRML